MKVRQEAGCCWHKPRKGLNNNEDSLSCPSPFLKQHILAVYDADVKHVCWPWCWHVIVVEEAVLLQPYLPSILGQSERHTFPLERHQVLLKLMRKARQLLWPSWVTAKRLRTIFIHCHGQSAQILFWRKRKIMWVRQINFLLVIIPAMHLNNIIYNCLHIYFQIIKHSRSYRCNLNIY